MSYVQVKTVDDAVTRIINWEIESGEIFMKFFMQKTVDEGAWAYWLLAKGYVKHANNILMELLGGDDDVSHDVLFLVYNENETDNHLSEENIIKNIELMAEFLCEDSKYLEKLNEFLEQNEK